MFAGREDQIGREGQAQSFNSIPQSQAFNSFLLQDPTWTLLYSEPGSSLNKGKYVSFFTVSIHMTKELLRSSVWLLCPALKASKAAWGYFRLTLHCSGVKAYFSFIFWISLAANSRCCSAAAAATAAAVAAAADAAAALLLQIHFPHLIVWFFSSTGNILGWSPLVRPCVSTERHQMFSD